MRLRRLASCAPDFRDARLVLRTGSALLNESARIDRRSLLFDKAFS
jgi:hypothetical protein